MVFERKAVIEPGRPDGRTDLTLESLPPISFGLAAPGPFPSECLEPMVEEAR